MPYVRASAANAADLSWDAFSAPTPEIENWTPDPDAVPVAGSLLDSRFNRDPFTERRKMALKRDKRLGLASDGTSKSTGTSSPTVSTTRTSTPANVRSWPTGPSRALASTAAQRPPPEPLKPFETPSAAPSRTLVAALEVATSSKPTNDYKDTMKTFPVQPMFRPSHTLPLSIASQASESPTKTPTPTWTRALAHLLGDESPPMSASLSQPFPAPAAAQVSSVSKPPHLRKQPQTSGSSITPAATLGPRLDSLEGVEATTAKVQHTAPFATLSLDNARHTQDTSAATRLKPMSLPEITTANCTALNACAHTAQELKAQKSLLESFIPKKPASSSHGHERYLQAKLIQLMEDDLDMSSRTTRREMNDMSDKGFKAHFTRTRSLHEPWWDSKQRLDETGRMGLKASLKTLQQDEK